MLLWLKAIAGIGSIAGLIKTLLLPLAYLFGRWQAFKAQWAINEKLQEAYDEIERKPLTDEEIDRRLDAGEI
jgi:hypothetical protein